MNPVSPFSFAQHEHIKIPEDEEEIYRPQDYKTPAQIQEKLWLAQEKRYQLYWKEARVLLQIPKIGEEELEGIEEIVAGTLIPTKNPDEWLDLVSRTLEKVDQLPPQVRNKHTTRFLSSMLKQLYASDVVFSQNVHLFLFRLLKKELTRPFQNHLEEFAQAALAQEILDYHAQIFKRCGLSHPEEVLALFYLCQKLSWEETSPQFLDEIKKLITAYANNVKPPLMDPDLIKWVYQLINKKREEFTEFQQQLLAPVYIEALFEKGFCEEAWSWIEQLTETKLIEEKEKEKLYQQYFTRSFASSHFRQLVLTSLEDAVAASPDKRKATAQAVINNLAEIVQEFSGRAFPPELFSIIKLSYQLEGVTSVYKQLLKELKEANLAKPAQLPESLQAMYAHIVRLLLKRKTIKQALVFLVELKQYPCFERLVDETIEATLLHKRLFIPQLIQFLIKHKVKTLRWVLLFKAVEEVSPADAWRYIREVRTNDVVTTSEDIVTCWRSTLICMQRAKQGQFLKLLRHENTRKDLLKAGIFDRNLYRLFYEGCLAELQTEDGESRRKITVLFFITRQEIETHAGKGYAAIHEFLLRSLLQVIKGLKKIGWCETIVDLSTRLPHPLEGELATLLLDELSNYETFPNSLVEKALELFLHACDSNRAKHLLLSHETQNKLAAILCSFMKNKSQAKLIYRCLLHRHASLFFAHEVRMRLVLEFLQSLIPAETGAQTTHFCLEIYPQFIKQMAPLFSCPDQTRKNLLSLIVEHAVYYAAIQDNFHLYTELACDLSGRSSLCEAYSTMPIHLLKILFTSSAQAYFSIAETDVKNPEAFLNTIMALADACYARLSKSIAGDVETTPFFLDLYTLKESANHTVLFFNTFVGEAVNTDKPLEDAEKHQMWAYALLANPAQAALLLAFQPSVSLQEVLQKAHDHVFKRKQVKSTQLKRLLLAFEAIMPLIQENTGDVIGSKLFLKWLKPLQHMTPRLLLFSPADNRAERSVALLFCKTIMSLIPKCNADKRGVIVILYLRLLRALSTMIDSNHESAEGDSACEELHIDFLFCLNESTKIDWVDQATFRNTLEIYKSTAESPFSDEQMRRILTKYLALKDPQRYKTFAMVFQKKADISVKG